LGLVGSEAFIEDSTALGSNSALAGLASIGHGALFALHDEAAVSTTGSLVSDGHIRLDTGSGDGGSSVTVEGTLTNSATLFIGNDGLSASDPVTAKSFVNSGTVDLIGNGTNLAALNVSGATTNKGSISITFDTEEFAGAVSGAGSFSLDDAHLRFDSSVSARQTIKETRSPSTPRSAVSGPATRSTRRTFSRGRRSISSRIPAARAARSPCTTRVRA
jgi:hypothetical protein